jgi:hypothetical protein
MKTLRRSVSGIARIIEQDPISEPTDQDAAGRTVALAATRAPHPRARYRQPSPIRDPRAPLSLLPRGGPEACVHVFEVSQELPRLLAPGSPFESIVSAFDSVPELLQLYKNCQDAYRLN